MLRGGAVRGHLPYSSPPKLGARRGLRGAGGEERCARPWRGGCVGGAATSLEWPAKMGLPDPRNTFKIEEPYPRHVFNSWPARPGACRRFERGAGSFLYSGPVGIWKRSGATRKQCLGGLEAQWPGMKKNITRLLFRRAFFTQKGSSTCGAIKSCAMTTRGRTAVPRGLLRVRLPAGFRYSQRVPSGYPRVPSG